MPAMELDRYCGLNHESQLRDCGQGLVQTDLDRAISTIRLWQILLDAPRFVFLLTCAWYLASTKCVVGGGHVLVSKLLSVITDPLLLLSSAVIARRQKTPDMSIIALSKGTNTSTSVVCFALQKHSRFKLQKNSWTINIAFFYGPTRSFREGIRQDILAARCANFLCPVLLVCLTKLAHGFRGMTFI